MIFPLLFFDLDEPVLGVDAARAVRKAYCAANTILAVIPARSAHGVSIMQVSARKTTSTILDGNHAVPPLYVCYLLRSRATPDSRLTYVREQREQCVLCHVNSPLDRVHTQPTQATPATQPRFDTGREEDVTPWSVGESALSNPHGGNSRQEMQMMVYGSV